MTNRMNSACCPGTDHEKCGSESTTNDPPERPRKRLPPRRGTCNTRGTTAHLLKTRSVHAKTSRTLPRSSDPLPASPRCASAMKQYPSSGDPLLDQLPYGGITNGGDGAEAEQTGQTVSEGEALRSLEDFLIKPALENEHYDLGEGEGAQDEASGTPRHESPMTPVPSLAERQMASPDPFVFTPTPNPCTVKRVPLPMMGRLMGKDLEMAQASPLHD